MAARSKGTPTIEGPRRAWRPGRPLDSINSESMINPVATASGSELVWTQVVSRIKVANDAVMYLIV